MEHGILRISETATAEIEAVRAIVIINVTNEKIVFGNAAIAASEDLKTTINKIQQISSEAEFETESVAIQTNSGIFGKNSTAEYTVKLKINDLEILGEVLGICAEAKKLKIKSLAWDYNEEEQKLELIQQAIQKAKNKAEKMMAVIGYNVVGIRSCSDSYHLPNIGEIVFSQSSVYEEPTMRARKSVDFGTQIKSKKQISATCTVEFLVKANNS